MTLCKKFGNVRGHASSQPYVMYVSPDQPTAASDSSKQITIWHCQSPEFRNLKSGQGETYRWGEGGGWGLETRELETDQKRQVQSCRGWHRAHIHILYTPFSTFPDSHVYIYFTLRSHLRWSCRRLVVILHGRLSKATHADTDTWRQSSPTWAASRASSSVCWIFSETVLQELNSESDTHQCRHIVHTWDY
jgi:hypothetical protein